MHVLSIETATDVAGVALADESGVLSSVSVGGGRRHGESVAPAVQFVCARAGITTGQLDAVAVDVGPGLFTGLRVGVATAKAFGFALRRPVVEVGSLELLALGAAPWLAGAGGAGTVLVPVVDARRGSVFSGRFTMSARRPPERVEDDRLVQPDELAAELSRLVASGAVVVCPGDGALRYQPLLEDAGATVLSGVRSPDAAVLARVGLDRLRAGAGVAADIVAARYLRPADVRIKWETRQPARAAAGA